MALAARELGVARYAAGLKPADKIARLEALESAGRRPLMVGDGLNDAPALAAALCLDLADLGRPYRPGAGRRALPRRAARAGRRRPADRGQGAPADGRESRGSRRSTISIAVPLAVLGLATPLIAALAMSGSSILVTLNALRARDARRAEPMNVLVYLVPIALALGGLGLAAFLGR